MHIVDIYLIDLFHLFESNVLNAYLMLCHFLDFNRTCLKQGAI